MVGTAAAGTRTWGWTLVGTRADASPWSAPRTGSAHYLSNDAPLVRGLHAQVGYRDIYRGIDVRYRGSDGRLEQDFLLAPGAAPAAIRFRVDAASATLTPRRHDRHPRRTRRRACTSRHLARGRSGPMDGQTTCRSRSVAAGDGSFGFAVGAYDARRPLVIDPVLTSSVAIGGNGVEEATAVALDAPGSHPRRRLHLVHRPDVGRGSAARVARATCSSRGSIRPVRASRCSPTSVGRSRTTSVASPWMPPDACTSPDSRSAATSPSCSLSPASRRHRVPPTPSSPPSPPTAVR